MTAKQTDLPEPAEGVREVIYDYLLSKDDEDSDWGVEARMVPQ